MRQLIAMENEQDGKQMVKPEATVKKIVNRVQCTCLKCNKKFTGASKFNRLCSPCRAINQNNYELRGGLYREN